jgi:hypothetical protein
MRCSKYLNNLLKEDCSVIRHAAQGMEHVMGSGAVTISSGIAVKQMGGGDIFTRMAVIRLKNTEEL